MGPDCERAYSLPTGSLQQHLMAGVANDPAARAGILVCAVGAIRSYQQDPIRCAPLFGLRGYVISCIQTAMRDPKTCHSNHTALAVASLGNFEVILGCEGASRMHLQGVASIKYARGASLHWVLDGILSWMATLGRTQMTNGILAILDQPSMAT